VYRGQNYFGCVTLLRDGLFRAFDSRGRVIGEFAAGESAYAACEESRVAGETGR
jgi:hypothetical protein